MGRVSSKYAVGTIYDSNNYGQCIIVEYKKYERVLIEFLDTGFRKEVGTNALRLGNIKDDSVYENTLKYRVGDVFKTNESGYVEITRKVKRGICEIKFLSTGSVATVKCQSVGNGQVRDPNQFKYEPPPNPTNRFVVYLHLDSNKIVRYVGSGTLFRAFNLTSRSKAWQLVFENKQPEVEIVAKDLSKDDAVKLEIELYNHHRHTICNSKQPFLPKEMKYNEFSESFKLGADNQLEFSDGTIVTGSRTVEGYVRVYFKGKTFMYHRIVFLLSNPDKECLLNKSDMVVDHIDRNPLNNHPDNLRVISFSENVRNSNVEVKSETGYKYILPVRKGTQFIGYRVLRSIHGKATSKHFKIADYESTEDALQAAYNFREKLIKDGILAL